MSGLFRTLARNRWALAAITLILLALLGAAYRRVPQWIVFNHFGFGGADDGGARTLTLNNPIKQKISTGKAHTYRITLSSGQYLRLGIQQWGMDASVTLHGPDGQKIIEYGCRQNGPTPVSLIAGTGGDYLLEVRSPDKGSVSGHYQVKIEEMRTAEERDKNRIAAERAFAEGERFQIEGKAESAQKAISKYQEALLSWQSASEKREEANTLKRIGDAHQLLSEQQKALESYNRALQISQEINWPQGRGEALNDISVAYLFLGPPKKALEYATQALNLSRTMGDQRMNARALNNIGEVYNSFGKLPEALAYHHQALPIWCSINDKRGQARTLIYLGYTYSDLSEAQKAFDYYRYALQLWNAVNDYRGQAMTLTALGHLYSKLGEKQEALNLYIQAKPLLQTLGDQHGEARILNGMGYVNDELGDKQRALEYHKEALHLYKALSHRGGESVTLSIIGRVYHSLGDNSKALDHCRQALSIAQKLADQRLESYLLGYIGRIHESLGKREIALDYYNRARSLSRAGKDRRLEAQVLNDIGRVYAGWGKKQKAMEYYRRALPLNQATGDRFGESSTLYNIACVERDRGDFNAARTRIEEALGIIESLRANVASHDLRTSYVDSIYQRYEFYLDLLMRLHKQRPSRGLDIAALEASERARARSLIEMMAEARANIRQGVNPELLERERSVQRALNAKADRQAQLHSGEHTQEEASAIAREIQELTTKFDEVKAEIRVASPRYAALTQPQPLSLNEIQQLLDDNTILLEYSLGADRSYLWAVTRTELKSHALPGRAAIDRAANSVRGLLTSRHPAPGQTEAERIAQYWREAAALRELLIEPVAGQLGSKRLLIVADGALRYIPFGALPGPGQGDKETRGQEERGTRRQGDKGNPQSAIRIPQSPIPLLVEHEIVYLPSASALAALRREIKGRAPAPKGVAVLADPVFDVEDIRVLEAKGLIKNPAWEQIASLGAPQTGAGQGLTRDGLVFRRLYSSKREAEAIWRVTSGDGLFAMGFEANLDRAINPELSQYRIVHFATHGVYDNRNPGLSAIVLSQVDKQGQPRNGRLCLHDIYNMNLPAEMVVLSSCDSALGKEFRGEGLVGLTTGFMYAGAARVTASLWKVDDDATAELMGQFYRRMLNDRMPPATALREAQIAIWRQQRWSAPYFWAAFVMQGEWR
ncbi:MAG: CHAT domain-containing protein [Blastocatellales bacterium]